MNIRNHKFSAIILRCTFVISIFLLLFTVSISYRQIQSVTDSEKWVIHSHEVQIDLQQLLYYVKDAETAQRGYLLTHDTVFFSAYQMALVKVKESLDKLKKVTADNKDQQKNITGLSYLIDERFALLTYIIGNKNLQITISEPLKKRLIKGKSLMDKMTVQSDKMLALEMQVLTKRETEHRQAINLSPLSYLLTAFFSLLVFIVAYYKTG